MNQNTTLDELMEKVDSRYTLVVVAAKRARVLTEKRESEKANGFPVRKPVTEALKDISHGRIRYRRTRQGIK
ncbi:MAG: DNA-directed RNA polymerase subunit omega [Peptococcaceae bacterium BICA1-7]|nr:MAG: DNA-directed RNA polymerase subunit omega [Peptococcaceae bacterium BICA1-7]HBV96538.1 DNA-directed RNA polymerase subunit omega [Desulfotomaculum sp.]